MLVVSQLTPPCQVTAASNALESAPLRYVGSQSSWQAPSCQSRRSKALKPVKQNTSFESDNPSVENLTSGPRTLLISLARQPESTEAEGRRDPEPSSHPEQQWLQH